MLELLASDYRILAQDILAVTLVVAAFIWGGGPERAVAATWLFVFEIPEWINQLVSAEGHQLADVDYFLASLDLLAGVSWIAIALCANRTYPLWIAGMQLLAMTAHVARGLADAISPVAYITMVIAPGWFQLFFLAGGVICHIFRKRKYGAYRDWRIHIPERWVGILGRGVR